MRALKRFGAPFAAIATTAVLVAAMGYTTAPRGGADVGPAHFLTADRCMACHNSLTTRSGRDASIGIDMFGASGKGDKVLEHFGISPASVAERVQHTIAALAKL